MFRFTLFLIVLFVAGMVLTEYFIYPAIEMQMEMNSRQAIDLQGLQDD